MTLDELFANLSVEMIDGFVAARQEEHLSLDFKTVGGPELKTSADKKNFAEVLSGFANSAGGIVIWGVATEKDGSGQDVATARKLIPAVAAFVNRLEEATPFSVTPCIAGVRHRAIEVAAGAGFAVTYIPESDAGHIWPCWVKTGTLNVLVTDSTEWSTTTSPTCSAGGNGLTSACPTLSKGAPRSTRTVRTTRSEFSFM